MTKNTSYLLMNISLYVLTLASVSCRPFQENKKKQENTSSIKRRYMSNKGQRNGAKITERVMAELTKKKKKLEQDQNNLNLLQSRLLEEIKKELLTQQNTKK